MTPEQKQLQAAIQADRINGIYDKSRDEILAHISRAYAEMVQAVAEWTVLESRIATGDMQSVADKHATMKLAMAGQNEAIQAAFVTTIATLESAQAIVHEVTGGTFIKGVPP